jgi:ribonuclease VapC
MIIDTSALIAILKSEPGADQLAEAILADPAPKMSAVTAVELYAVADVRGEPAQAARVDNLVKTLRITIVGFDETQARLARQAYRDYGKGSGHQAKLNLGDCYSYALAAHTSEPLLCVGEDFIHTDIVSALPAPQD